jgi:DNA-binding CsgD family transcriptional regulator
MGTTVPVNWPSVWSEHPELSAQGEQLGVQASWAYWPETGQLVWSDNYFRLLGLAPDEIVPSAEWVVDHLHPSDSERVTTALAQLAFSDSPTVLDYRVIRDDGLVRHVRSTLAAVDRDAPGGRCLLGTVQDLTSHNSLTRQLAAHAAVSKALDEWQGFAVGAESLLAGLGIAMSLPFGVLWVPRSDRLEAARIWHVESPLLATLAEGTRNSHPGHGDAILGRAWAERRPIISGRPGAASTARRAEAMRAAGIASAVAIPAVAASETLAILEFLTADPVEDAERMRRAFVGLGYEVGYFLAQRRGELAVPVLTPRETEVLQLAARGVAAKDIAAELGLSSATVKRHFEDGYSRLGMPDRASAVAEAMRQGLID